MIETAKLRLSVQLHKAKNILHNYRMLRGALEAADEAHSKTYGSIDVSDATKEVLASLCVEKVDNIDDLAEKK